MRTIFKYVWPVDGEPLLIERSREPTFLHVGAQDGKLCVWAEVNSVRDSEDFAVLMLVVVGTGQPVPPGVRYVGTAQVGAFVWHVYCE